MKKVLISLLLTLFSLLSFAQKVGGFDFGRLKVKIRVDQNSDSVYLSVQSEANKYFSVGFGEGMAVSDAIIISKGFSGSEGLALKDYQLTAKGSSGVRVDTQQDWKVSKLEVTADSIFLEASRKLNTGDAADFMVDPNANSLDMIWAMGNTYAIAYHGNNRGVITVDLEEDVLSSVGDRQLLGFELYPNPSPRDLKLEFSKMEEEVTIQVYNMEGDVVLTGNYSQVQQVDQDISWLAEGVYIVSVKTTTYSTSLELIKQ